MKAWTRNPDIQTRLQKKYNQGDFLLERVSDVPFKPLRIPLKHPSSAELSHNFGEARTWIDHVMRHSKQGCGKGFDLEWRETNHRTLGRNAIPVAALFNSLEDIFAYLGKTKEAHQFFELFTFITDDYPELKDLLKEKPLDVLSHGPFWTELLAIVSYVRQNPRPMIYLRQLEIPGVDTKFIEQNKPYLSRLLSSVLPKDAIDDQARGTAIFEKRFGFLSKPLRIRFRILDPKLSIMGLSDLEITETDFRNLPIRPNTVFIVENEINGLAFPPFPTSLVIFGLGYGLDVLSQTDWMKNKTIWYWGDIDTHGFAMLDRLRHYFPQTRSFLMDEETLLSHRSLWGSEATPTNRDLPLLTPDEANVYDTLRNNHFVPSLRMEQERISFSQVRYVIENIYEGNHNSRD